MSPHPTHGFIMTGPPQDQPDVRLADDLPEDATVIFERKDNNKRFIDLLHDTYKRHIFSFTGPSNAAVPRNICGIVSFSGGLGIVFDDKASSQPSTAETTLLDRQLATLLSSLVHERSSRSNRIACVYITGPLSKLTGRKLGGEALFGKSDVSEGDVAAFVMKGLPTQAVDTLQFWARLTDSEVDQLVIPRRTLRHRREKDQALTKEESDRAARMARIISHAEQVFDNPQKADIWLRRELKSLNGAKPLELAETEAGARVVEELLEKIAWGAAA